MLGLNNTLSPCSTTRIQSMEFMHTSSYEPDSEECDEFEDMSPNQPRLSPASMCCDQGTDQLQIRIQGLLGESRFVPISPAASYGSMKSDQSMIDSLTFSQDADVRKVIVSPTPTLGSVQSEQSMEQPGTFNRSLTRFFFLTR
ncbi:E3 ubiquitin-protein ligase TRIM69-like [Tachysurus ichikawai]